MLDTDVVVVRFGSNGVGRIAGIEWIDDRFRLVHGEMTVTEGKLDNYLSFRFEEDGVWTNRYYLAQYKFSDKGDLILWLPKWDAFEAAIKTDLLQGVITRQKYSRSITVTNSTRDLLEFLDDPERANIFEYREPMVLRRIAMP